MKLNWPVFKLWWCPRQNWADFVDHPRFHHTGRELNQDNSWENLMVSLRQCPWAVSGQFVSTSWTVSRLSGECSCMTGVTHSLLAIWRFSELHHTPVNWTIPMTSPECPSLCGKDFFTAVTFGIAGPHLSIYFASSLPSNEPNPITLATLLLRLIWILTYSYAVLIDN